VASEQAKNWKEEANCVDYKSFSPFFVALVFIEGRGDGGGGQSRTKSE
jgi:hypothetical protein